MTNAITIPSISPAPRSASRGSATCCCRTSARHVPTAYSPIDQKAGLYREIIRMAARWYHLLLTEERE